MIGRKQSPLPRNARRLALTLVAFAAAAMFAQHAQTMTTSFSWNQLPPIPDHEGFAGSFAGVSGGALVVAVKRRPTPAANLAPVVFSAIALYMSKASASVSIFTPTGVS